MVMELELQQTAYPLAEPEKGRLLEYILHKCFLLFIFIPTFVLHFTRRHKQPIATDNILLDVI